MARKRGAEDDEQAASKKIKSSPVSKVDDDVSMASAPDISPFTYAGPSAPRQKKPLAVAQMRKRAARNNPLAKKPQEDCVKLEIKWLSDRLQYESEQNGIKDAEIDRITRLLNRALMERDLSAAQVFALRSRMAALRKSASEDVRRISLEVFRMAKERAEWFAQISRQQNQMEVMEKQAAELRRANLLLFTQLSKKERAKEKGKEYAQMVRDRREFTNRSTVPRTSARLADRKPPPILIPTPYAESSRRPITQRLGHYEFTTRELTPPPSVSPDPCAYTHTTYAAPASPDDTPPASPTPRRARSPTPPMEDPSEIARRTARASLAPRLRPRRADPPQYRQFQPPPAYDEDPAAITAGSLSQLSIGHLGEQDMAILDETPRTMPGYLAPFAVPPRRSERLAQDRNVREATPLRECIQEGLLLASIGAAAISNLL